MKNVVKLLKIKINNTKGIPIIENPNNQTNEIVNKLLDRVLNRIFLVSNLVFKEVKKVVIGVFIFICIFFSIDKVLAGRGCCSHHGGQA